MGTTIGNLDVATTGSNHVSPGPAPATSLSPPPPPAGPVPAPYVYISRSSTAQSTSSKLTISGSPVLVIESTMAIEQPGNIISQPTGADIVTHVANMRTTTCTGADTATSDNKKICRTRDSVYLNVPTGSSKVAQLRGFLIKAGDLAMMSDADKQAWAAQNLGLIDPVSVATGEVFDEDEDLVAKGLMPIAWRRSYLSSRAGERSPLGRGGWTHSLHQYCRADESEWVFRDETGRDVRVPAAVDAEELICRQHQLRLRRAGPRFEVYSFDTYETRTFAPLAPGGLAMLRRIQDLWGNAIELDYEEGRLVRATGPSGRAIHLTYDEHGRITSAAIVVAQQSERAVAYAYTDEGELGSVTDAIGRTHRYLYDGHHRLIEKRLPYFLGFHYQYDDRGRCVRGFGDGGIHKASFSYDLEEKVTYVTDTPRPRIAHWNEQGAVLSIRTPDGRSARDTAYDEDLHPVSFKNAAGLEVTAERDTCGRLVRIVGPGGEVVESVWDDRGFPSAVTRPGGLTTTFRHNDQGALTGVTYPSGIALELAYDGRGRLEGVFGPDGTITRFEYDEHDNVVREIGPFGEVTSYAYDALGQVTSRTDALGRAVKLELDAIGQKIAHRDAAGNVTRFEWDARGRVMREIHPNGSQFFQQFGGTKSLIEQIDEEGQSWRFEYDGAERVRRIENPKREAWELRYDRSGQMVEERPFDGRVLRYEWGLHEQLARLEANDGSYRQLVADDAGRRVLESTPHGDIELVRDELGRIVTATLDEPLGKLVTTLEYDDRGRLVAEGTNGRMVRYTYGPRNMLAARELPDGQRTEYHWDLKGRLAGVVHGAAEVVIERDAIGHEVTRRIIPGGTTVRSTWDACERLTATRVTLPSPAPGKPEPLVLERSFAYDDRGWPLRIEDSRRGVLRYEHDATGRLREAQAPGRREIFDYDAAGSVIAIRDADAPSPTWRVQPGNVLLEGAGASFASDDNRQRTSRVDHRTGETTEYLWDCRGRLREVRFASGERVIYAYDAFGRRVRKDFHPPLPDPEKDGLVPPPPVRSIHYVWAGQTLAAEIHDHGVTRAYVHEPGTFKPVFQAEGDEVFAYVLDHLGAPMELLSSDGSVAWACNRTAFGAPVAPGTALAAAAPPRVQSPFRLLGQYHDEETGLAHTLFRYFDADTARWLSPDPAGFLGGPNLAAFNGNPTAHVDPLGLYCAIGSPAWDRAFQSCPRIPPLPGHYDVIVHGTPTTVDIMDPHGRWSEMSIKDLADMIRRQSDYAPGTPIRLVSCNTGRDPNGVAQQLSNELGVPVLGPTRTVYPYDPTGGGGPAQLIVAGGYTPDPNTGAPIWNDHGTWVPYTPAGSP